VPFIGLCTVKADIQQRDPDFQARVDAHYARQTQRKNRAEAEGETEEVVDVEEDDYDEE
jgi:adenosyl cobinamide kinase/adenosyl cobinamide phosphate guanylyltransferase